MNQLNKNAMNCQRKIKKEIQKKKNLNVDEKDNLEINHEINKEINNDINAQIREGIKSSPLKKDKIEYPKEIKRYRKEKYPEKKDNYKKYHNAKWNWNDVFEELKILKDSDGKKSTNTIAIKYNIKEETLRKKYRKWENCKNYNFKTENRGGHNKLFTIKEEKDLLDYVINVFIDGCLQFTNEHLKLLAIQKYNALQLEKNINFIIDENFNISDKWVVMFKKRWRLSSLKTKLNRKAINIIPNELTEYLNDCDYVFRNYNINDIYNLDETFWKCVNLNGSFIGITNSDNRKVNINIDPKTGFTVVFIICADGSSLNPIIILKGKTSRSLNKINKIDDTLIYKKISNRGWINDTILIFILNEIAKKSKNKPIALILDKYGTHTKDLINNEAKKLNIKLIFVPTGMTSVNQPLDVNYNGPVKSMGKYIMSKLFIKDPYRDFNLVETINVMLDATKKISSNVIKNAFIKACNLKNDIVDQLIKM